MDYSTNPIIGRVLPAVSDSINGSLPFLMPKVFGAQVYSDSCSWQTLSQLLGMIHNDRDMFRVVCPAKYGDSEYIVRIPRVFMSRRGVAFSDLPVTDANNKTKAEAFFDEPHRRPSLTEGSYKTTLYPVSRR